MSDQGMPDTTEREFQFDIPEWLHDLLELAKETGKAMFDAEQQQKFEHSFEESAYTQMEFKLMLRRLYFWYEPKFKDSKDVSTPNSLDLDNPTDVYKLDFKEARELFRSIRDLMEEIGHTKFSSAVHEEEGVGING
jgi:hypothetical protein